MNVEIQSDRSTANSLTDRLGAGPRTKHIDTRSFWVQERVQVRDLTLKGYLQRKFAQMWERSQSVHQDSNNIANVQDWYPVLTVDPTLHYLN